MSTRKTLGFLLRFAVLGLAAAFVLVVAHPELLPGTRPVVHIQGAPPAAPRAGEAPPDPGAVSFRDAVRRASPAVVNVYSARAVPQSGEGAGAGRRFFWEAPPGAGSPGLQTGLGSGVIFSTQGHVLTNHHVIMGANRVHVMLADGRSAEAERVGSDPDTDLAVLRIDLPDLPVITFGDSSALAVGDVVLAIGNPYGVGQAVSLGIVSATGRKRLGLTTYENFIQTDAAINPGNSGGALVNGRGELVGVSTAIYSRSGGSQGVGFAIPVALVRDIMTQIIEHGHVVRGWLGISMSSLTPGQAAQAGLAEPFGVVVTGLFDETPAEMAGLQPGDILVRVNRQRIYDARHMLDVIARQRPGSEVQVEGIRRGNRFSVEAIVTQRPAPEPIP